jgi:hypothetical protein
MSWKRTLIAGGLALSVLGCQTMGADYDQPARITNATEASRAALRETINAALNTEVTLADDALTDSSVLTIEHTPPRTMQNPTPEGRILTMPLQFRLVINESDCILIDPRDRSRHLLNNTTCAAE